MREFKTSPYGDIVDLDDKETFKHLPNTIKSLGKLMLSEIGYAICYMDYWHKDVFKIDDPQRKRVNKLIKDFTENEINNYKNVKWYREQVFLFQDEIENMC